MRKRISPTTTIRRCFRRTAQNGLEPTIDCTFPEFDEDDGSICVDIGGISSIRDSEFLGWLTKLLKPFGGIVHEAGYGDPPRPDAKRPTDH